MLPGNVITRWAVDHRRQSNDQYLWMRLGEAA